MIFLTDSLNKYFKKMYGDLPRELVGGRLNAYIYSELMQDRKKNFNY